MGPLDQASCADPVVHDHGYQHYKHRPTSDRSRFAGPFPMFPENSGRALKHPWHPTWEGMIPAHTSSIDKRPSSTTVM